MKIHIQCPACSQKLRIPLSFSALKVTCPRCSSIFYYKLEFNQFFKKISGRLKKIFAIPERKFEHSSFGYTNFNSSRKTGKIFTVWILILLGLLILSIALKTLNDSKIKRPAQMRNSETAPAPQRNTNELSI